MSTKDIHVLPIDDMREHEKTRECWCQPTIRDTEQGLYTDYSSDDGRIVVHRSMDGRELVEDHGLQ